ncbi:2-amino-4-hydroxy-6-hydroxymethyldihydropteridine diphosphokinase [Phaeobacter sp. B1627]|uniref:2-amino-4-hydroxy-6- hydroxymethyldihydropteridine diphosphokinase n=1 Tax=Phaeobacter sp. B1627 TaxID=2583809 RepID=UPI001118814B|nr:2-amino-4-hydroxy-6-hydroxymethyldihydropteridine diphosphokinase [Phaeobacter sp. B1627]TNJ41154.1 2-amino-4-hydroxy-6-hydroxymethyldihydropteridine diphosphokinase [Phaeobacter sp. B1627]
MTEYRSNYLIALGSNLENEGNSPLKTLQDCLQDFSVEGLQLAAVSRFFSTPCFPAGAGPDYVNAAVALHAECAASEVLARLHRIEARFRRTRTERWGMRTLDLDLLAASDQVVPDLAEFRRWHRLPPEAQRSKAPDQLILPHPRLQDRAFVLVPLADIARHWVHPVLRQSVAQLLSECPAADVAEVRPL